MCIEQGLLRWVRHLGLRNATQEMSTHVVRFWGRRVVGITADVEVVAIGLERGVVHDGRKARLFLESLEGGDNLLDVLRHQEVLRTTLEVFAVGIDEQYLALPFLRFAANSFRTVLHALAQHQDARRDACTVEQVGGDADDSFQQIVLDHAGADGLFFPATEKHAVGHDGGHLPAIG
ncbi:hypothetical protein D3C71_1676580 [compost metagenome]